MRALVTTFTLVGISLLIGIPFLTESAAFSSEPETVIDKRMRAQRSAARPRSVTAPRFRVGNVGLRPAARAVRVSVPRSTASPGPGRRYFVPQGLRRGTDGGWNIRERSGNRQSWVQGLSGWQRFSPSNGTVGGPWSQRNGNTGDVTRPAASGSGRYGAISDTNIRASSAAQVPVRDLAPQQPPWGLGSTNYSSSNRGRTSSPNPSVRRSATPSTLIPASSGRYDDISSARSVRQDPFASKPTEISRAVNRTDEHRLGRAARNFALSELRATVPTMVEAGDLLRRTSSPFLRDNFGRMANGMNALGTAYGIWNDEMRTLTNANSTGEQRGEAAFYMIMDTAVAAIPFATPNPPSAARFMTPVAQFGLETLRPGVRRLTVNSGRLGTWTAGHVNAFAINDRVTGRSLKPVMQPVK